MNACALSRPADDAGVSVHVVRDLPTRPCHAPDAADGDEAAPLPADPCQLVKRPRRALAGLEATLAELAHSTSKISA